MEQRNQRPEGPNRQVPTMNLSENVSTLDTLMRVEERNRRRVRNVEGTTSVFFDNTTSRRYNWLLPGWVAEERTLPHGRLYRFYYDPLGNVYKSKGEVLYAWERAGLRFVDP